MRALFLNLLQVLDPQTSPMTWAMHTIGWLEVKERYRAESSFYRQMLFNRNVFQVRHF